MEADDGVERADDAADRVLLCVAAVGRAMPPRRDEEAIDRILDVADAIIAERGSAVRIADVARTLGVTRQTVYRYFPSAEELLLASGMRTADGFLDQLAERTSGLTEPAEALVEGIAFAVETLAEDAQFANLLRNGSKSGDAVSLTSDTGQGIQPLDAAPMRCRLGEKRFRRGGARRVGRVGSAHVSLDPRRPRRARRVTASPCAASSPGGWDRPSCTRG